MAGIDYIKNYLSNEGFRYEENEGHISFKYEGVKYVALKNSDSPYLQIVILFFDVNSENRVKCLEVCNEINANKFVIKFTIDDDTVWCNYELRPTASTTDDEFSTILSLMSQAVDLFYEKMRS